MQISSPHTYNCCWIWTRELDVCHRRVNETPDRALMFNVRAVVFVERLPTVDAVLFGRKIFEMFIVEIYYRPRGSKYVRNNLHC